MPPTARRRKRADTKAREAAFRARLSSERRAARAIALAQEAEASGGAVAGNGGAATCTSAGTRVAFQLGAPGAATASAIHTVDDDDDDDDDGTINADPAKKKKRATSAADASLASSRNAFLTIHAAASGDEAGWRQMQDDRLRVMDMLMLNLLQG